MIRYTEEQKQNALARMTEVGVKKAQEETGVSIQTLYKWRTEQNAAQAAPEAKPAKRIKASKGETSIEAARALLGEDDALQQKIQRLEEENARLLAMNLKLKKALLSFVEA